MICSSVNRDRFMSVSFPGDGLYLKLEEFPGLRSSGSGEIQLYEWLFRFETAADTEYVERLVVEVSDIPKENWPTLTTVEQDPNAAIPRFPFAVNERAHSFRKIEPHLINLESYLSIFGLEEIVYSELSVEWVTEDGDKTVGILGGYSELPGKRDDPAAPISNEDLARCIVAANAGSDRTAGLAHFRVAQINFFQGRFIETIRHAYLCLEQLFAPGKHQKNATVKQLLKSEELTSTITKACFDDTAPDKSFSRLRAKYEKLEQATTVEDILVFLFKLRGELQHAKSSANAKWHPSRQQELEDEALFLINLAGDICFNIVLNDMRSVPRA